MIIPADDQPGASAVAVLSFAYSQKRFGNISDAVGQSIRINNIGFTVIGVTPPEFYGVDPAAALSFYLPVHANLLLQATVESLTNLGKRYLEPNDYWIEIMGRLRPGVSLVQAQSVLGPQFRQWVATTASTHSERETLPTLFLKEGAGWPGYSSL